MPLMSNVRNHMRMTQEEIDDQKKVEFYAASVAAWYASSLEHDKSLLTLSAGGIGLLITLLTTVGLGTAEALVLYVEAITSFVVSLVSVLFVFRGNQRHIQDILAGKNQGADPVLSKLDGAAIWSFGIGVVFTAVIGISAAIHSFSSKEKQWQTKPVKQQKLFHYARALMVRQIFNLAPILARALTEPEICSLSKRRRLLLHQPHLQATATLKTKVVVESDF